MGKIALYWCLFGFSSQTSGAEQRLKERFEEKKMASCHSGMSKMMDLL